MWIWDFPSSRHRRIIIDIITVAAETTDPELAVLGSEISEFDLESINPDETSEQFQCLAGQFNLIEIVAYIVYNVVAGRIVDNGEPRKTTWVVFNREFSVGQVIDMGIEFGEMTSQAIHAYDNENDAQRCALATVACYLGQPDMIENLVNE